MADESEEVKDEAQVVDGQAADGQAQEQAEQQAQMKMEEEAKKAQPAPEPIFQMKNSVKNDEGCEKASAMETFTESFDMAIRQNRLNEAGKELMLEKVNLISQGRASEFTSLEKNITVVKDPYQGNVIHIDFCVFSMKDTPGDEATHFDFSYAYSKAMIKDASLEQQERA